MSNLKYKNCLKIEIKKEEKIEKEIMNIPVGRGRLEADTSSADSIDNYQ